MKTGMDNMLGIMTLRINVLLFVDKQVKMSIVCKEKLIGKRGPEERMTSMYRFARADRTLGEYNCLVPARDFSRDTNFGQRGPQKLEKSEKKKLKWIPGGLIFVNYRLK